MTMPLLPRSRQEIAPGAVHVPDWLSVDEQRHIVTAWRQWAKPPAPMRATRLPNGGVMSVKIVCLGWHWVPYRYTRFAEDTDGAPVTPFPDWLGNLGRRAVAAAYQDPEAGDGYQPDAALVNYYDNDARLGLHQDKDERTPDPVVSLSVGNTCVFRLGNPHTRSRPYTDIELHSGDLFVFGGPSRLAYHGVPRTIPHSGNPATGLSQGRINITMRVTGLIDPTSTPTLSSAPDTSWSAISLARTRTCSPEQPVAEAATQRLEDPFRQVPNVSFAVKGGDKALAPGRDRCSKP